MNAPQHPEKPPEPLQVIGATVVDVGDQFYKGIPTVELQFNRLPTERELRMYRELPSTPVMFADAKGYAERVQLAEVVVMIFRTFVLGNLILPETPKVMDWLKSWIDGVGHGPLGGPLRWPDNLPFVSELLTGKGFIRTAGEVGYVARLPKRQEAARQ